MKRLESSLSRRVVAFARARGVRAVKVDARLQAGWPDYTFFPRGGLCFLIEFKREGEKPRILQKHTIEELRSDGYRVYVVSTVEEGIRVVLEGIARSRALAAAARSADESVSDRTTS